jgi:hypothetical protein
VGVAGREAERAVDARLELVGEVVLEPFRLLVHLIPREAERLHEVELEQPGVAHNLERHALAGGGERGAVVALLDDQPEGRELLQHRRRRRRRHPERVGERGRGHLARALELPDCLRRFANHCQL